MTKSGINLDLIPLSLNPTELDCLLILLSRGQATKSKYIERALQFAYLYEYIYQVEAEGRQALKNKWDNAWDREEWLTDDYENVHRITDEKQMDKALEEFANGDRKAYGEYLTKDEKPLGLRAEQKRLRIIKVVNNITTLKIPSHGKVDTALKGLRDKQFNGFRLVTQDKATGEWHLADKFYLAWQDRRTEFLREAGAKSNPHSTMLLDFYLYTDGRSDYHSFYVKHINELKRIMK